MDTHYPIKYNRGKIVKYPKPIKPYLTEYRHSKIIDKWETVSLSDLIEWVNENGGEYKNAILELDYDYRDEDAYLNLSMTVPLTQPEKDQLESEYQAKLADWNEWKELSKTAVKSDEEKEKEKRAKSLKTQEMNLLNQLQRIRKQQDKL